MSSSRCLLCFFLANQCYCYLNELTELVSLIEHLFCFVCLGLCKRQVEGQAKRREQRQEEQERLRKQQGKALSAAVAAFWLKVEHIVWEDQKRALQSQLQQQKEKHFDRFVKKALRLSKSIAGGIRRVYTHCSSSSSSSISSSSSSSSISSSSSSSSSQCCFCCSAVLACECLST